MLRILLVAILALVMPTVAWACSCTPNRTLTIPAESKATLLVGTVTDIQRLDGTDISAVTVTVDEPLLNTEGGAMVVYTSWVSGTCGYPFHVGNVYVITADYVEGMMWGVPMSHGTHAVNLCGNTRELNTPEGQKALAAIREEMKRRR